MKHEIEVKSRQIETFLMAFQQIVDQYRDDPDGFEEAKRRLFHKVQLDENKLLNAKDSSNDAQQTMTHLEKLRHKDPKKLRGYAEKWHDVSHDHDDDGKYGAGVPSVYSLFGSEF